MNTTLTSLEELNKQLVVEVPMADFNAKFDKILNDLKTKITLDGFRQGKVPINVIKQKYGATIKNDAANDLIGEVLPNAFLKEKVTPAGQPILNKIDFENSENFSFVVQFETFPVVELNPLNKLKIEKTLCEISKEDEEQTLAGLKEQATDFKVIKIESQIGDRLKVDFKGFVEDKEFAGGSAKDFSIVLGKGHMIPGFEEGLVSKKVGEEVKLEVTFPKDYEAKELAGKLATFIINIKEVATPKVLDMNDEFAKKFGKNTMSELLLGIKAQMTQQLGDKLDQINKDAAFSAVLAANKIEVPKISVETEAQNLLKDMQNKMKQQGMNNNTKTELNANVFNDEATRRVKLGLLIGNITATHNITASETEVEKKLQHMAEQHGEQGQQMINYYRSNKDAMDSVRSMVVEKLASDFIMEQAEVTEVTKNFNEIIGK